jgi:TetR/AcrR family transcriptional repressor of nem operon
VLASMITAGIKRKQIRRTVEADKLATLIISSLEGALVVSRLERRNDALQAVQVHLNEYLDAQVRRG